MTRYMFRKINLKGRTSLRQTPTFRTSH